MKKTIYSAVVACFGIFSMVNIVGATPVYYTFDGTITSITNNSGMLDDFNYQNGDDITYTFLIDLDLPGQLTYYSGSTVIVDNSDPSADFYYADYFSGDALPIIEEYWIGTYNHRESNYIRNDQGTGGSQIAGLSFNNSIRIANSSLYFQDWTLNTPLVSWNDVWLADGTSSRISASLNITKISDTAPVTPVPEPATILLFGLGMVALIRTRSRRRKS
jgi:hypothetical protein